MNGRSLVALLLGLVLGTGALAAPVPKHLFPKPQSAPKPEPSADKAPGPLPSPHTTEDAARSLAKLEELVAKTAADKKAIAEGTYIAPPPAPGTVILQIIPAQVGPPPTDRAPQRK